MTEVTPNLPHLGNFCKYCFMGTLLVCTLRLAERCAKQRRRVPASGLALSGRLTASSSPKGGALGKGVKSERSA